MDLFDLEVRSVLSYYSMLRTKPAGTLQHSGLYQHQLHVARRLRDLDHCKSKLGIGHKQVTATGSFRWKKSSASGRAAGRRPCR